MRNRIVKRGLMFASVMSVLPQIGMAANAAANAPQATADSGIEEVLVTARRKTEELKDVPMSVDVVSGAMLDKLRMTNFTDIQQISPGLQLSKNSDGNASVAMRGVSFNPYSGTSGATTDIYFNEANAETLVAFNSLYDVQQIEVLRGPQGLLRGRTAPSGAITITTRRPDMKETTGYGQYTLTDRGTENIQGAVSLPLFTDVLAIRVAALSDRTQGNGVRDVNRGQKSQSETTSGRLSIGWKPRADMDVNVVYQHLESRNRDFRSVIGPGADPILAATTMASGGFAPIPGGVLSGPNATASSRISVGEGLPLSKFNLDTTNINANWDLGGHTLSMVGYLANNSVMVTQDTDIGNALPGVQQNQTIGNTFNTSSWETRLASNDDGKRFLNYTGGVYHYRNRVSVDVHQNINAVFPAALLPGGCLANGALPLTPSICDFAFSTPIKISLPPSPSITESVFGSLSLRFNDQWKMDGGLRANRFKNGGQMSLSVAGGPNIPLIPANLVNREESATTGGLSLSYRASEDISTYLSYGRSYRASTVGAAIPQGVTDPSLIASKPETSKALELGVKASLFEHRAMLSADVYYQKFTNFIDRVEGIGWSNTTMPVGSQNGVFGFNYNGDAKVTGFEAQFMMKASQQLSWGVNAAYANAHYLNANVPCNRFIGTAIDFGSIPNGSANRCATNRALGNLPKFSLTAHAEYKFDRIGVYEPFVRGLVNYRPGFDSDIQNYKFDSITDVNLYGGVRSSAWTITGFVKNLLGQNRAIPSLGGGNSQAQIAVAGVNGAAFLSGYQVLAITNPREFGVTAQYDF